MKKSTFFLCALLFCVVVSPVGCKSSGQSDSQNTADLESQIGFSVPANVVFASRDYVCTGKIIKTVEVLPGDFSYLGVIATDEGTDPVEILASNGRVFAIEGTEQSQGIAVRFESSDRKSTRLNSSH